jgi:hypothetical protein
VTCIFAFVLGASVLGFASTADAARGDCGQPVSNGTGPVASDCLGILNTAVGFLICTHDCLCDVDGSGATVATDALACLNRAVGNSIELACTSCGVPVLEGLDPSKSLILPITIQAAYNDDTMFFRVGWEGDRGDTHDYIHYTGGAWQREGFPRRETQSTIDNDPARGPTNRTSNIYESRLTFMVDDPNGPNAVAGFAEYGCYLTCHDDSRAMPTWDTATDRSKYLNDGTAGSLDLWHRRLHRANPLGASDDQFVSVIPMGAEDTGGRIRDAGSGPWQTNNIDMNGNPTFAIDPSTSVGRFAFPFEGVFTDALRIFRRDDAVELGNSPIAVGIDFLDAVGMGYVPQEGDTIPRRRLRTPTESAGDISGFGTTFTPSAGDPLFGHWDLNTQRLLDTGNPDDTALAPGGVYTIAFAVHTGRVTVRDHYVGFPMRLSLGGGSADIEAVSIAGSGRDTLPDFSDTVTFPVVTENLFLPGIASLEFLNGDNTGLTYIDPETSNPVDQNHAGAAGLLTQGLGCRDCHTAANTDSFDPPQAGGFDAGSMEALAPQRGGVSTPTPIPPTVSTTTTTTLGGGVDPIAGRDDYDARCAFCHRAGSHDASGDFSDLAGDGDKLVMDLGALDEFMDGLFMTQQEIDNMAAWLDAL